MLETLRPLAVFAKVVELGSFRAAASALGVSHSVVSHHVSQLEARLGVQLIYRTTRRLSLTRHGERLFDAASAMIEAAETGIEHVTSHSGEAVGRLRITAPAVLAAAHLIDDVAAFCKLHPRAHLALNFTDTRRDLVAEGIDLAIRMGRLADSSLRSRRLAVVNEKLLASPAYVAARASPRSPSDLASWDWVSLDHVHRRAQFRSIAGTIEFVSVKSSIAADDAVAIYRLARAGLGLTMVPDFLSADDIERGSMMEVLPDWRLAPIEIFAVWPSTARRASLTKRFVDFLALQQAERTRRPATGSSSRTAR